MDSPDAPAPQRPNRLANTQRQENRRAAQQNISYNRIGQRDQFGNTLNYRRIGTDANGNPRYQAQQNLGAQGQRFMDNMGGLSDQFFQGAREILSSPLEVDSAVEKKIYDMGAQRLDPRFQKDEAALRTQLANQGISLGSEAFSNAQGDFGQAKNDAYNALAMNARGQAYNEAVGERNQQLSELMGLGGQGAQFMAGATNPQYAQVPQINLPGIDMMGLYNNQYNQQMQAYQQRMGQSNARMGAIAGMVGTIGGAALGGPIGASIGGSIGSSLGGSSAGAPTPGTYGPPVPPGYQW
jgi:hypothetical protein